MKLERTTDEWRENQARLHLQELTKLSIQKIEKDFSAIDWAVLNEVYDHGHNRWDKKLVAFAEFKGQLKGVAYAKRNGFMLTLNKWLHLKHMSRNTGIPFWLIYGIRTTEENTNYIGVFWHDTPPEKIIKGGRTDRNLESDLDFIVKLTMHYFTPIDTKEHAENLKDRLFHYPLARTEREYQNMQGVREKDNIGQRSLR